MSDEAQLLSEINNMWPVFEKNDQMGTNTTNGGQ